jgi:serine protease Do
LKQIAKKILICISILLKTVPLNARPAPESFADTVEKLIPSVVNISSSDLAVIGYFPQVKEALGSGFIIDEKGTILTNYHIVNGFEEVTVILHDESKYKAEVIGGDEISDIALLKIKTEKDLKPVEIGDSNDIRIGDWVLAIGNPFGFGNTVTAGILSAKARSLNADTYLDYFQTDAAINSGNSGGPLFNINGEVIGVNSAIASPSPMPINVGIGFAVPINSIKNVIRDLKIYGEVRRGRLGISILDINPNIQEVLNLKTNEGVFIMEVVKNSPAHKDGIKSGDVIIKYNDKTIENTNDLIKELATSSIDDEVSLTIIRNGKKQEITTTISSENNLKERAVFSNENTKLVKELGVKATPINKEIRAIYGLEDTLEGLFITQVKPGSIVMLRPGNIILKANNNKIKDINDLEQEIEVSKQADDYLTLVIANEIGTKLLSIKLD